MNDPSIPCARVSDADAELGSEHPQKYRDAAKLTLGQFWQGADAFIGASETGLCFYIYMRDSDIFSRATADNQKMWTLGDVAELFVKPGGERSDYWEIHVTPNDFIMDIYIPEREQLMGGKISWEEVLAPDSHTRKRVHVGDGSWAVEACVPWSAFDVEGLPPAGSEWKIAVCRYNCTGDLENQELSSTASFSEASFHRHEEYTTLVF